MKYTYPGKGWDDEKKQGYRWDHPKNELSFRRWRLYSSITTFDMHLKLVDCTSLTSYLTEISKICGDCVENYENAIEFLITTEKFFLVIADYRWRDTFIQQLSFLRQKCIKRKRIKELQEKEIIGLMNLRRRNNEIRKIEEQLKDIEECIRGGFKTIDVLPEIEKLELENQHQLTQNIEEHVSRAEDMLVKIKLLLGVNLKGKKVPNELKICIETYSKDFLNGIAKYLSGDCKTEEEQKRKDNIFERANSVLMSFQGFLR